MAGLVRQPLPLTLYKNTQLIILSVKILSSFGSKEPFRTPERRETDIVRRCLNGRKSGGCDIPRPAFQFPRIVKDLSRPHVGRDRPTPCLFGSLIAHSRTWSRQLPRRSAVDIYLDGNPSFAPPLERQMMVIHHRFGAAPSGQRMGSAGLAYTRVEFPDDRNHQRPGAAADMGAELHALTRSSIPSGRCVTRADHTSSIEAAIREPKRPQPEAGAR